MKPSDLDNTMAGLTPVTFRAGEIGYNRITNELVIGKVHQEMSISRVHIYRAARLTIKVKPTRVKLGQAVTVTGRLTRADWDSGTYRGYAGRPVLLSYHYGVGGCEKYKTVITGPDGHLRSTFKPNLDTGPVKWNFDGNSTTGRAQSPTVMVDTTEKEPCL